MRKNKDKVEVFDVTTEMRFFLIKVRDKTSGETHIVGEDRHDSLYVGRDGCIHYQNLQNCDGTGLGGGYEFVPDWECGETGDNGFRTCGIKGLSKMASEFRRKRTENLKKFKKILAKNFERICADR